MRLNRFLLPLLALVAFLGVIGVAQASGNWVTSGRSAAAAGAGAMQGAGAGEGASIPAAGALTPADLKGWMTIDEAATGLGVRPEELIALLGDTAGAVTPATALKDVEALVPGFSMTSFRAVVQDHLDARTTTP